MSDLYLDTLRSLIASGQLDPAAPTLAVAAGETDRAALIAAGFTDVTISNLDVRMRGDEFAPYAWQFLDAEDLDVEDEAYDQVIEHMGLHHCGSPHRALQEMYRVARKAVLVLENRDSALMRIANALGVVPTYELEAVEGNDYRFGGYRNSAIPNFVYRWTERDVAKTVAAFDPAHKVPIRYFYYLRFPEHRIPASPGQVLARGVHAATALLTRVFPKQCNAFGIFLDKANRVPLPWIDRQTGTMMARG
jgi:ubiquinone/menaquinone biosynthesis C-methylase UbiE